MTHTSRPPRQLLVAALLAGALALSCDGAPTDPGPLTHPVGTLSGKLAIEGSPSSIAISSKGIAWVTLLEKNEIARFAAVPSPTLATSFAFAVHPSDVVFNRAGSIALVGAFDRDRAAVYSVDAASGESPLARPMQNRPYRVAIAPDDSHLYVLMYGDPARVYSYPLTGLLDGAQSSLIQIPGLPRGIAVSPTTGDVIVTTSARVARLDPRTLEAKAMVGPVSIVSEDVVVTPDGARIWYGSGAGSLVALDATSLAQVAELSLDAPIRSLAMSRDGAQLWATSFGDVLVIDAARETTITRLPLGGTPVRIAFDQAGTAAFVANVNGWVDVIR